MTETMWGLSGTVWAFAGAALAVAGGGIGSAIGLAIASNMATGIIAEDSEKFGRLLPIVAMPGTQGIYGFITGILVTLFFGLLFGEVAPDIAPETGMAIFLSCLPVASVCLVSAIYQGVAAAAASGMVARRDEESGRALIFPALVETYAVFSLISTVLMLLSVQSMYGF